MATTKKKTESETSNLIDPIYQRFVGGVLRSIGSTEFYAFFMNAIANAENQFQFSNRKLEKTVDETWVDAIEESLEAMQQIVSTPRHIIKEEDLIVNIANAKRCSSETVQHLAQHSQLIQDFNQETGDVRPERVMQRFREESFGMYENRLVFTTMENAYHFVKIRHDALFEAMSDEFGAKLKINSDMDSATEHVHLDMFLHIKSTESALKTDEKNADVFARISRLYRVLATFMNTGFAQEMSKLSRVKGNVTKTNVLKKNKNYKQIVSLYDFLRHYGDVGYTIKIIEQNPKIDENFEQNIFRNILFNYLVLKGYLEDERDRRIPTKAQGRSRKVRPKIIHQIVEELTEDYNLPDVEIRKVLIEELTKAQLMQEEAAERRRLVEEQEKKKKEEGERIRAEKKAEQERRKAEREVERERKRQEKEAEQERKRQERMAREAEEQRVGKLYREEVSFFVDHLEQQLRLRREDAEKAVKEKKDFSDAVILLEEAEQRRKEELKRERKRKAEEKRRLQLEQEEAEELARKKEREEQARIEEEKRRSALQILQPYTDELSFFNDTVAVQQRKRRRLIEMRKQADARREVLRKERWNKQNRI